MEKEGNGNRPKESEKLSIHSNRSQQFMAEEIKARKWQMNIIQNEFMLDFYAIPNQYSEKNHMWNLYREKWINGKRRATLKN